MLLRTRPRDGVLLSTGGTRPGPEALRKHGRPDVPTPAKSMPKLARRSIVRICPTEAGRLGCVLPAAVAFGPPEIIPGRMANPGSVAGHVPASGRGSTRR